MKKKCENRKKRENELVFGCGTKIERKDYDGDYNIWLYDTIKINLKFIDFSFFFSFSSSSNNKIIKIIILKDLSSFLFFFALKSK